MHGWTNTRLIPTKSLLDDYHSYTGGWLSEAIRVLTVLRDETPYGCRHVLVTASHLAAALAKLLLFGLDEFFPLEMVYSASATSKTEIFAQVLADADPALQYKFSFATKALQYKFSFATKAPLAGAVAGIGAGGGVPMSVRAQAIDSPHGVKPASYVYVVGDGTEEQAAAHRLKLPFHKIRQLRDLSAVPYARKLEVSRKHTTTTPREYQEQQALAGLSYAKQVQVRRTLATAQQTERQQAQQPEDRGGSSPAADWHKVAGLH